MCVEADGTQLEVSKENRMGCNDKLERRREREHLSVRVFCVECDALELESECSYVGIAKEKTINACWDSLEYPGTGRAGDRGKWNGRIH